MMSEEQEAKPWDKMEGESEIWFRRFDRYRLMYPVRSVAAVYQAEKEDADTKNHEKSRACGKWYDIAKQWNWEERAQAYDAYINQEEEQARLRILSTGYALQHRRIEVLSNLTQQLLTYVQDEQKVWLLDVKAIGNGPLAERVDLVNFNAPLFTTIEKMIKSIAEETGERTKKKDTSTKEMPPNVYVDSDPNQDGVEP